MRNLFIKFLTQLGSDDRAHDIDHIERVVATARQLGEREGARRSVYMRDFLAQLQSELLVHE